MSPDLRWQAIAKEIAAALFITKPYALNSPFGRSKGTNYLVETSSLYGKARRALTETPMKKG
jgi:hypothetical protein